MADALDKVRIVQAQLNERYSSEPWFRGVGICKGRERGTFAVELMVAEDAEAVALPSTVDGVEVRAVKTGRIRAYQGRR